MKTTNPICVPWSLAKALLLTCAMLFGLSIGCTTQGNRPNHPTVSNLLQNSENLTLYSLEPEPAAALAATNQTQSLFHGYKVLGKLEISSPEQRSNLIAALQKGMSENTNLSGLCFNPRHGIQARTSNDIVDLVICFECLHVRALSMRHGQIWSLTSQSPAALFNETLEDGGVLLPKN